jgi:ankyrin repeat protein
MLGTPLYHACLSRNFGIIKLLIAHGADPNKRVDILDSPADTPLKAAIVGKVSAC